MSRSSGLRLRRHTLHEVLEQQIVQLGREVVDAAAVVAGRRRGSTPRACASRPSRMPAPGGPARCAPRALHASSGRSRHSTLRWTAAWAAEVAQRLGRAASTPKSISSARWVSESYIGVSTPVRAHSTSRATARALNPTCAMRCRRVQPGSSDGSSNSSSRSSFSLRAQYACPRRMSSSDAASADR